ncbi:amino acid ABC transporter substrate-binding protein, PAAT family [Neptunomonas antarctica]|uniref:Amino acid ABC transporter substrate-binding protein, PAAT family n=1 Tax=Neptunomonas antarctica TaxID=619304 RepID=A0A1N7NUX4_9GAMM|nr:amino acid ABC transporter substrate-binding protein, PAAT family [Neptunomonas antarctica]
MLLIASPLKAESLRIVTEELAPCGFQVDDEARGFCSEVVLAVLKQINLQAPIEFYPWARAYEIAQAEKNILIYSIARIPEREALFHWVGAIAPYKTSLYKLKANTSIQVNSINQAKKYQIGVALDDVRLTYLQRHKFPSLKTVSSNVLNIRLLANNRIDLIAYDEASFAQILQDEGLDASLFERVFRLDELSDQVYMAFSLGSDTNLVTAFRDGLKIIKMNGIYDQIQIKYRNIE